MRLGSDFWSMERGVAVFPIGTQGRLVAEHGRGADFGIAAVVRAVGGDLGGYRFAGCRRAVVTRGVNCSGSRPTTRRRLEPTTVLVRPERLRLQPADSLLPVITDLVQKTGLGRRVESSFPDPSGSIFH
jgi:hypothetical protein